MVVKKFQGQLHVGTLLPTGLGNEAGAPISEGGCPWGALGRSCTGGLLHSWVQAESQHYNMAQNAVKDGNFSETYRISGHWVSSQKSTNLRISENWIKKLLPFIFPKITYFKLQIWLIYTEVSCMLHIFGKNQWPALPPPYWGRKKCKNLKIYTHTDSLIHKHSNTQL